MKFLFVIVAALSVACVLADPNDLIDVTVNSAALTQPGNIFLKLYGINSNQPVPIPVNVSNLNGVTYVDYSTPVQNATNAPNWSNTYAFSNFFFTQKSYVIFEIWNTTYDSTNDVNFLGGAELTITQLQALQPPSNNIVLTNNEGLSPGLISVNVQSNQ